MSSQETLQQVALWPVGKSLCFWLLMFSLWQLREGQGFLELPPLPTPLLIYDMDLEIGYRMENGVR